MAYTYKATGNDEDGFTLSARNDVEFMMPQLILPKGDHILHPTAAATFAAAQEHAREHGQTIVPADLKVAARAEDHFPDVDWDDEDEAALLGEDEEEE